MSRRRVPLLLRAFLAALLTLLAAGSPGAPAAQAADVVTLSLPALTNITPGQQQAVNLSVAASGGSVYSADLRLTWNPAVVTLVSVAKGPARTNWTLLSNPGTPGEVLIAMATGSDPLTAANPGVLLVLTFQAAAQEGQTQVLAPAIQLNEGAVQGAWQGPPVVRSFAAPVVGNDNYGATEDTQLTVAAPGVLGNDSDTPGDTLTAEVVSPPAHGTLNLAANGGLTYLPAAGYVGPDAFTYDAVDALGGRSTATVSLTVVARPRYQLGGAVRYWNGARPMAGAAVTVSGDAASADTSDGAGVWAIGSLLSGDYTLTPSSTQSDAGAITAYDASLVLQHVAHTITLTGPAAVAADANQENGIHAMDASLMLQRAVHLIELPFSTGGPIWLFDPATRSYADLAANQTSQDFAGVLLGDPSGNWGAVTAASVDGSARVWLGKPAALPDGTQAVALYAEADEPFHAVDVVLAAAAGAAQVVPMQGALGAAHTEPQAAGAVVRVAVASAQPLPSGAPIAVVTLRVGSAGPVLLSATVDDRPTAIPATDVRVHLPLVRVKAATTPGQ